MLLSMCDSSCGLKKESYYQYLQNFINIIIFIINFLLLLIVQDLMGEYLGMRDDSRR